jgi:hypothetical protein
MKQEKRKNAVSNLWRFWWISLFVIGILAQIHAGFTFLTTGISPYQMLSGHQLFSAGITIFFFLPLMVVINALARRTQMHKIIKRSLGLVIFLAIWSVFALVAIIKAAIM